MREVKEDLRMFLKSYLSDDRRSNHTARIPHMAITGPPGVGKTVLARALHEALNAVGLVNGSSRRAIRLRSGQ